MMDEHLPDAHQDAYSKTVFGFWVYLLTDFMMFATLFAAYAVLHTKPEQLDTSWALAQTLVLLTASFTAGLAGAMAHRKSKVGATTLFALTFVLGSLFLWMVWVDFARLVSAGHGWDENAQMSALFTLVGTHVVHVVLGLLWTVVLLVPLCVEGLTLVVLRRLTCLRMFWQFVNVVWVFIFAIVYLMGAYA